MQKIALDISTIATNELWDHHWTFFLEIMLNLAVFPFLYMNPSLIAILSAKAPAVIFVK